MAFGELTSFVEEPHTGIDGINQGEIINPPIVRRKLPDAASSSFLGLWARTVWPANWQP